MTIFTLTTPTNFTQLVGKTGSDTYNINGGALTFNSDTRYGPNATPATGPFGNITGSTPLGGAINILGNSVRLIPYSAGTGNVPTSGTLISRGTAQAELLCVMARRTGGAVTAAGAALPASGWLKVRNVSAPFTAGVMTGIAATATAPDETGWMELVGVASLTMSTPHLCPLNIIGVPFDIGLTTGVRGQTLQLPAFDAITEYPGVDIEDTPGGAYSFWPNAAANFTGAKLSSDSRCRMVSISPAGLLTLGTGRDGAPAGHLPAAGCKVRVPNIIFSTAAAANLAINMAPAPAMTNRYELACGGAPVSMSNCTGSWFINLQQPLSVSLSHVHSCDQIALSRAATPVVATGLQVGLSNQPAPLALIPLLLSQCFEGGTLANSSALRADQTLVTSYIAQLSDLGGVWNMSGLRFHCASDPTAVAGSVIFNNCDNVTVDGIAAVGKRVLINNCGTVNIKNLSYADSPKQATPTTAACSAVEVINSRSVQVMGITNWPGVANAHPYNGLVAMSNVADFIVTGQGSAAAPYDAGTLNPMGQFFTDLGNNQRGAVQRNWFKSLRVGLFNSNPTSRRIQASNNYNLDATKSAAINFSDSVSRGNRHNGGVVPPVSVGMYGTCFRECFTSDTTAQAALVFVDKTSLSANAYTLDAGAPRFTGNGSLVMAAGDRITWTWPHAMLGWTGLSGGVIAGTNLGNHLVEYDLDKGAGFTGVYKNFIGLNLVAETGISPTTGFKLRMRVTCGASSTTNLLTSILLNGATTLALQNTALYPLVTALPSPLIPGSTPLTAPGTAPPLTTVTDPVTTAQDIAAAVLLVLQATILPVNMVQVKGQAIHGAGSETDPWGP